MEDFIFNNKHDLPLGYTEEIYNSICTIIEFEELNNQDIRIIINGNAVPAALLSSKGIKLKNDQIINLYSKGATIVLNGVDRYSKLILNIKELLSEQLKQSIHGNIYLTPKNANGVGFHTDEHDVVILQIEGKKKWSIKDENNLITQHFTRPGTWHFIKRGVPHTTETINEFSCHITFGVNSKRKVDLERIKKETVSRNSTVISNLNKLTRKIEELNLKPRTIINDQSYSRLLIDYINRNEGSTSFNGLKELFADKSIDEILNMAQSANFNEKTRTQLISLMIKARIVELE